MDTSGRRVQHAAQDATQQTPAEIGKSGKEPAGDTHQVWHLGGYPSSRIAWLTGSFTPRFPDDYIHVANVQADSLAEASSLTIHGSGSLEGTFPGWQRNPGVEALVFAPRSTDAGDVIIAPSGKAYQVQRDGFGPVQAVANHSQATLLPVAHLAPSDLALQAAADAAESLKAQLKGDAIDIDAKRSGQLSPSHTPGRSRR